MKNTWQKVKLGKQLFGSWRAGWKLRELGQYLFVEIETKRRRGPRIALYDATAEQVEMAAAWNERERRKLSRYNPRPIRLAKMKANRLARDCMEEVGVQFDEARLPAKVSELSVGAKVRIAQLVKECREEMGALL